MKYQFLLAIAAVAGLCASCSSSKPSASDYEYRQWLESRNSAHQSTRQSTSQASVQSEAPAQASESRYKQRPTRTKRELEPCMKIAMQKSDKMRGYGTATSYVLKAALAEAEIDAANRIASMMKTAVEGAAQDYIQNTNQNLGNTATTLTERVMSQFVNEVLPRRSMLETTIYDLSDGKVEVWVCLELDSETAQVEKRLENELGRSGVIQAQYDRDRFIKKMAEGLEKYKQQQAAEQNASEL